MAKGKLAKFADMAAYPHVFEYPHSVVEQVPIWKQQKVGMEDKKAPPFRWGEIPNSG